MESVCEVHKNSNELIVEAKQKSYIMTDESIELFTHARMNVEPVRLFTAHKDKRKFAYSIITQRNLDIYDHCRNYDKCHVCCDRLCEFARHITASGEQSVKFSENVDQRFHNFASNVRSIQESQVNKPIGIIIHNGDTMCSFIDQAGTCRNGTKCFHWTVPIDPTTRSTQYSESESTWTIKRYKLPLEKAVFRYIINEPFIQRIVIKMTSGNIAKFLSDLKIIYDIHQKTMYGIQNEQSLKLAAEVLDYIEKKNLSFVSLSPIEQIVQCVQFFLLSPLKLKRKGEFVHCWNKLNNMIESIDDMKTMFFPLYNSLTSKQDDVIEIDLSKLGDSHNAVMTRKELENIPNTVILHKQINFGGYVNDEIKKIDTIEKLVSYLRAFPTTKVEMDYHWTHQSYLATTTIPADNLTVPHLWNFTDCNVLDGRWRDVTHILPMYEYIPENTYDGVYVFFRLSTSPEFKIKYNCYSPEFFKPEVFKFTGTCAKNCEKKSLTHPFTYYCSTQHCTFNAYTWLNYCKIPITIPDEEIASGAGVAAHILLDDKQHMFKKYGVDSTSFKCWTDKKSIINENGYKYYLNSPIKLRLNGAEIKIHRLM